MVMVQEESIFLSTLYVIALTTTVSKALILDGWMDIDIGFIRSTSPSQLKIRMCTRVLSTPGTNRFAESININPHTVNKAIVAFSASEQWLLDSPRVR